MKTVATARHVAGLRAAAFLTAGIARVPFWKFLVADAAAAAVTVPLTFALAYLFTNRVTAILADVHRVEHWVALAALIAVTAAVIVYVVRSNRRVAEGVLAPVHHPHRLPRGARQLALLEQRDLRAQVQELPELGAQPRQARSRRTLRGPRGAARAGRCRRGLRSRTIWYSGPAPGCLSSSDSTWRG